MRGEETILLGQLVYGSTSGDRDFRILADSGHGGRDDRDVVRQHSNLGGGVQTAVSPAPLFAAYPLDREAGRWAFSRTVFLGAGGRGNDYLAHVLVLDETALDALRGDFFLLEGLGVFSDRKPPVDSELPPIELDFDTLDRASARPLGSDARFPLDELPGLLAALAAGPVALPAQREEAGTDLCRTLLSVLPPTDRRLAFASRFALPRRVGYRLTAFAAEDRALVERNLAGFEGAPVLGTQIEAAVFAEWLLRVEQGFEPVAGLSLLERPRAAVDAVEALEGWRRELETAGDAGGAAGTAERERPLVHLATLPANRRLPRLGQLHLAATAQELIERAAGAIGAHGRLDDLFAAVREARSQAPPEPLAEALARTARSETTAPERGAGATAAAIALRLLDSEPAGPATIYSRSDRGALWSDPEAAAGGLRRLAAASPGATLEIAADWLRRWRQAAGEACLEELAPVLVELAEGHDPAPLNLLLAALERAAPRTEAPEQRQRWLLGLLRRLRPRLGSRFPLPMAVRLVAGDALWRHLDDDELAELVPAAAHDLPRPLLAPRVLDDLPRAVLARLLSTCEAGLRSRDLDGEGWDLVERPERWELATRVAMTAARRAAEAGDGAVPAELVWLVWSATALADPRAPWASDEAPARLAEALDLALEAATPEPGLALRAAWRLERLGVTVLALSTESLARLRERALAEPDPGGAFHVGTLVRVAHFDRARFAVAPPR